MKLEVWTGGPRDYVGLIPENMKEAAAVVFLARESVIDKTNLALFSTPEDDKKPLELRIYLSSHRGHPDPDTLKALDETP